MKKASQQCMDSETRGIQDKTAQTWANDWVADRKEILSELKSLLQNRFSVTLSDDTLRLKLNNGQCFIIRVTEEQ